MERSDSQQLQGKKRGGAAPTVQQIQEDILSKYAAEHWLHSDKEKFDAGLVDHIYYKELVPHRFPIRRVMLLEFSQYLEKYLWPNFSETTTCPSYVLSICVMVNEKFREKVPPWDTFKKQPKNFPHFFNQVLKLCFESDKVISAKEKTIIMVFLIHCFNSLEMDLIRERVQKLVSLAMWTCILPGRLELELKLYPKFRKYWNLVKKKDSEADQETLTRLIFEREILSKLIKSQFLRLLDSVPETGNIDMDTVHFCERFLELLIDLEALLPTRRFFNVLLDDHHIVTRCTLSRLAKRETEGKLFRQLTAMLKFYAGFEINDQTGVALTDHEMAEIHYNRITSLQRAAFKHFKDDLLDFCLANVASVDTRENLTKHFSKLSTKKLHAVAAHLKLVPLLEESTESEKLDKEFLMELLVSRHERRSSQIQVLNETPIYPTEQVLWDENIVPAEYFSGEGCLALPKLNLQFLTLHDYLLRNHNLFQLESTYEVREDVEGSVSRLRPWKNEVGDTEFRGWSRMATPIAHFNVVEVGKPNVGEHCPSRVKADVTITLTMRKEIQLEWEALRKHDVCFLMTVRMRKQEKYNPRIPFSEQFGIDCIRGCEIEGMLDEDGTVIEEGPEPKPQFKRADRTFRVCLDTNQYQLDMDANSKGAEDIYGTFNVFMRRKPKENNFKAVLETIRDLMNTECLVPDWLHDIFLGYDDPSAAHYTRMPSKTQIFDFVDTFLSHDHLKASFPGYKIEVEGTYEGEKAPLTRLEFKDASDSRKRKIDSAASENEKVVIAKPYVIPNRGPYPYNQPKRNAVPFTPTQVEAIRSGMNPGLTMVVGPPGTGKTDVAVQIISNIYHNFPDQRTLIVTHSNQALNQLFEKIMALDIDERHLLRLGHGEETLDTEKDFSRYGRVNFVLARRLDLLKEVKRLQESLGVQGDMSYTCETAGYFFLYQVVARIEEYHSKLKARGKDITAIEELFPFKIYFQNAPQPIFKGNNYEDDLEIAEGCFRHLKKMFTELEEYRAFELLRSGLDRSKYLLIKTAKIIAMTCTHAALKRRDLVELNFKYDNVLMEEAAQILEIETFVPLMLQNPEDGHNRLKRVILIGDHHQLPPVIKNMAFQKFSNMEQSLFARFVRLGVPYVELDAQGRARSSLCNLYRWRYDHLGDLNHISTWKEYQLCNPGFVYDFQLLNIEDFNGIGESEPNPYFFQNLGEAEYAVALFMYMRLLDYPADKITILTTYNGQKHLIRDVINQRCGSNPLIGRPSKVTTVDRFQGQQNDYIILSLVRTRSVGHLRDVRRLVVAMSRARLGLYVLARVGLFQNCYELTPAFNQFLRRPLKLFLVPWEHYPARRRNDVPPVGDPLVIQDMPHFAQFVYDLYSKKLSQMEQEKKVLRQGLPEPPRQSISVERKKEELEPKKEEPKAMEEDDLILNEVAPDQQ